MPVPPRLIAIDGPAASGKSSLGRVLAGRLGYRFLDTGLMYRAVTLAALRAGIPPEPHACEELLADLPLRLGDERDARVFLGPDDVTDLLHTPEIERHVSAYSALSVVRHAMREMQRAFASAGRAVVAGRDIGDVVLPTAPLKFYLEASEDMRETRRSRQRQLTGRRHAESAAALRIRDARDSAQTLRASDAIVIDTTHLSFDEVLERAWETIQCSTG